MSSKLYPDEDIIIPYDYLIYAAGARIADYGVKGVSEHCSVLKEVDDVRAIKNKVCDIMACPIPVKSSHPTPLKSSPPQSVK